jgi:outer membrane lipase/esterase
MSALSEKHMHGIRIIILTLLFSVSGSVPVRADPFTHLWIFGDSTVDTGWYRKSPFSGETRYDKYIKHPNYGVGRPTSSPGKISVEVLADALGTSAKPQNQSGTNYATGGARNVFKNTAATGGFPKAVPTVRQIKNYLANHTPGSKSLYLISSGDNDVAVALKNLGSLDPKTYVENQANSLAIEIKALAVAGAKYIVVVGLPESFGTPAAKQQYRQLYDSTLQAKLASLNVANIWADLNGVRKLIEQYQNNGPSPFGIEHYLTSDPACSTPAPNPNPQLTIDTDWAYVCSPSTQVPSQPTNADASEFADDNHWATAAQKVLGGYFYCLAEQKWGSLNWPSTNSNLPYDCKTFPSPLP